MTFEEFLLKRKVRNTPQGDFTRDARSDEAMADITTWDALKSHLRLSDAREQTVEAGRLIWHAYLRAKKKT